MIAALVLFLSVGPADGTRLAPSPSPAASATASSPVPVAPWWPTPFPGAPLGALSVLGGLAVLAAVRRPDEEEGAGEGAGGLAEAKPAPLVVFVSGHGNASPPATFARLIDLMGLDPAQARFFDYRWAEGGTDHGGASQQASIDETAIALNGYLAGLAETDRPIYLVGFSKGAAGIAELVARWDRGDAGPTGSIAGVALLDPPMASGIHGLLQSLGRHWGPIPDDGGYDPVSCSLFTCTDTRRHLGQASGVEVVVVRNPKAAITNFADVPEGLRVYEAADEGPGLWESLFSCPWRLAARVSEAHSAVLGDPRVAGCIVAEMQQPGTCDLPVPGHAPPAGLVVHGPGGAFRLSLNKTL